MSSSSLFVIQTPTLQKEYLLEGEDNNDDTSRLGDALKEQIAAASTSPTGGNNSANSGSSTSKRRSSRRRKAAASKEPPPSLLSTIQAAASPHESGYSSLYQFLQYIKATLRATYGEDTTKIQFVQTETAAEPTTAATAATATNDNDKNDTDTTSATTTSSTTSTITIRHAGVGALVEIQFTYSTTSTSSSTTTSTKDDGGDNTTATSISISISKQSDVAETPITIVQVDGQEPPPDYASPRKQPATRSSPGKSLRKRSPRKARMFQLLEGGSSEEDNELIGGGGGGEGEDEEEEKREVPDSTSTKTSSRRGSKSDDLQKQWDTKWFAMLEKVKQFKLERGHANVPKDYIQDRSLGSWVSSQRTAYKEGRLKPERIKALNELDFIWSFRTIGQASDMQMEGVGDSVDWKEPAVQRKWKAMLERLKDYAQQNNGNTRVPSGYKADPQLAYWVQNQRVLYRKQKLPQERIDALEAIGFLWRIYPANSNEGGGTSAGSSASQPQQAAATTGGGGGGNNKAEQDVKWYEMLERVKAFKAEHGHTVVPQRYEKDLELGKWVQNQRRIVQSGKMKPERKAELDALEFVWKVGTMGERTWQDNFERLLAFKEKWGDCLVPTKYEPDQRLASWVMWQRGKYHQNKLPDEYIRKLDEIGFVWKVQRKGRRINHTSDVRGGYKNSTGFIIWSPSTSNEFWEAQLEKLKAYKAKFGHTNVPVVYFEDLQLAKWVTAQRMMYTKGSLTQERIDKLEAIGFVWRLVRTWEDNFDRLKAYHEKHGHCNVPIDDPDDPKLGRWVKTQRAFSKRKELTVERLEKLRSLGFEWNAPKGTPATPTKGAKLEETNAGESAALFPPPPLDATTTTTPPITTTIPKVETPMDKTARLKATNARLSQDRRDLEAENRELRRKLREAEEANSWEDGYDQLQDYVATHGDAHVPIATSKLGQWVSKQRDQYKRNVLSQERIEKLEQLGFDWTRKRGRRPNAASASASAAAALGSPDDLQEEEYEEDDDDGDVDVHHNSTEGSPPTKKQKTTHEQEQMHEQDQTQTQMQQIHQQQQEQQHKTPELLAEEQKLQEEENKLAEAKRKLEEEKEKLRLRREAVQAAKAARKQLLSPVGV